MYVFCLCNKSHLKTTYMHACVMKNSLTMMLWMMHIKSTFLFYKKRLCLESFFFLSSKNGTEVTLTPLIKVTPIFWPSKLGNAISWKIASLLHHFQMELTKNVLLTNVHNFQQCQMLFSKPLLIGVVEPPINQNVKNLLIIIPFARMKKVSICVILRRRTLVVHTTSHPISWKKKKQLK